MKNLLKVIAFGFVLCTPAFVPVRAQTPAPEHVSAASGAPSIEAHADPAIAGGQGAVHSTVKLGNVLPLWSVMPFVLTLLAIALLPLFAGHWWEHNRNKAIVGAVIALPVVAFLFMSYPAEGWHGYRFMDSLGNWVAVSHPHPVIETALDYVSFIVLLGALFVIAGGIHIKGEPAGTPLVNTALLAIGAVLANFIGTTGASMLLIRPLLRANKKRRDKVHVVVFFIFVVSNIGGLLTPLGDPPLFLGFLKGVPFGWTMSNLLAEWALANGLVLVVFNLLDQYKFNKEDLATPGALTEEVQPGPRRKFAIEGGINLLFLAGVVAAAYLSGRYVWPRGAQEASMFAMAGLSVAFTQKEIRKGNAFTYNPIVEVAVLFAGIFITMIPALLILNARGAELGITQPWQFFWATGMLSSFLDNAPTYLALTATASGLLGIDFSQNSTSYVGLMLSPQYVVLGAKLLTAISCGAVFMGANSYIGNGPNFMVKAVAEENGVKMPSFFGYMAYSMLVLIPIFVIVTFVFFRS